MVYFWMWIFEITLVVKSICNLRVTRAGRARPGNQVTPAEWRRIHLLAGDFCLLSNWKYFTHNNGDSSRFMEDLIWI